MLYFQQSQQMNKQNICVGFWRSETAGADDADNKKLPRARSNDANYIPDFFEKCVQWTSVRDRPEMQEIGFISLQYKGFSRCRCCNIKNGSQTFIYNGFEFPSGYFHYILEHKINVPIPFQIMIVESVVPPPPPPPPPLMPAAAAGGATLH